MANLKERGQKAGRIKVGIVQGVVPDESGKPITGAIRTSGSGTTIFDLDSGKRKQRMTTEFSSGLEFAGETEFLFEKSERFGWGWAMTALASIMRGEAEIVYRTKTYNWESLTPEVARALLAAYGGKIPEDGIPTKVSSSWRVPSKQEETFLAKLREWFLPQPEKPRPQGQK